jgi:putative ABC transport system permease protein
VGTSTVRIGQQLGRTQIYPEGVSNETNIITSIMAVDENFIPTMGMNMAAGRNFSLQFKDSLSMIINEEMMRMLKWDDGVGRKISFPRAALPRRSCHERAGEQGN